MELTLKWLLCATSTVHFPLAHFFSLSRFFALVLSPCFVFSVAAAAAAAVVVVVRVVVVVVVVDANSRGASKF